MQITKIVITKRKEAFPLIDVTVKYWGFIPVSYRSIKIRTRKNRVWESVFGQVGTNRAKKITALYDARIEDQFKGVIFIDKTK